MPEKYLNVIVTKMDKKKLIELLKGEGEFKKKTVGEKKQIWNKEFESIQDKDFSNNNFENVDFS